MLFGLLSRGLKFDPEKDIPDLTGKVILVTGGNVGLGKETIYQLSKHNPAHIYLLARTSSKAREAIESIKSSHSEPKTCPPTTFIQCDLTSLPSVVSAAKDFVAREKRLDKLFLNAGIMFTPPGVTEQGYEIQFGTNHMGHALLTKLLLPTLLRTAEEPGSDVRVVSLSSLGHYGAPFGGIRFAELKSNMDSYLTTTSFRYGQSKLANILFAKELARRNPSLKSVAVHPGVVSTELWRSMATWPGIGGLINLTKKTFFTTVQDGTKNQLWAGTADGVQTGEYYMPVGISGQGSSTSNNAELAKKLWEWTEKELEGYNL